MSSDLFQKLCETRNEWEEARKAAQESRDKNALAELYEARKNMRKALKNLEESAKNANRTANPELRKREIDAYQRLLKIQKTLNL